MSLSEAFQGVRTLEQLKLRCRIDADTGCWIWALAYSKSRSGNVPVVYLPKYGRTFSAMRAAVMLSRDLEPEQIKGKVTYARCGHCGCVNPMHLGLGNSKQFGQHISHLGRRKDRPAHRIANTKIMRSRSELTEETVAQIRAAQGTLDEIASQFGNVVGRTQIWRIRRGLSWKPGLCGASVFSAGV